MVIGGLPGICNGLCLGYSAVLLPELEDETELDIHHRSWVASLTAIFIFFGSVLIGVITHKIGRKYALLLSLIFQLIGWVLIGVSNLGFELLCIGRSLQVSIIFKI